MNYRIGYIGFGGMASGYHYDTAIRDDVPFTPTAVFDLRESQRTLAAERGLKAFDNLGDFLDSRLFDFVLVATPNQYHCPMVCAALDAGYHAMSEKPAAMNSKEIEEMIAHSEKAGKMFTVHHNRRWDRDFLMLKQALETGRIGKVFTYENRVHANGNGQMTGWRGYTDHGGGMFLDWGIHMMDQTLALITEPVKSVYADIHPIRSGEVDDYAKVLLRFESGVTAQVEVSTFAPTPLPKWAVYGDRGSLIIDTCCGDTGRMRWVADSHDSPLDDIVYPDYTVSTRQEQYFNMDKVEETTLPLSFVPQDWAFLYKNVAAALDGTEALEVTPQSVLRCFRVIEAAFRSAETGCSVAL